MKTLEAAEIIIYRFRCSKCFSLFEMTEEERRSNDREFTEECFKKMKRLIFIHTTHVTNSIALFAKMFQQ